MKRLRVAIIGQGRSGRDIHGSYFLSEKNRNYEVVAVVELIEERRERARKEYGDSCEILSDYKALYGRKDIDLVVNSTFSHLHYPVTMDLLTHGFNVLVEKPFSAHKEECDAMIRAASENNVKLAIFQQSHFAPYYRRTREIMDSGILGRIVQVSIRFNGYARRWDWQCSQRFYGGALRNTGPHPMEQALDILDQPALPEFTAYLDAANVFGDAEDFVKILMKAPGKPVVDLEISSCDPYNDGILYRVQGTRGALKATANKVTWQYFKEEEAPRRHIIFEPLSKEDGTPAYCSEQLEWHKEEEELTGTAFDFAVADFYKNLYDHITDGVPLVIPPEKVARQIEMIEEVHRRNPMPIRY